MEIIMADLLIVGAGLFGLTVARQAADEGYCPVVIERREHIGGNAWATFDSATGIEVHRYGAHIFHTDNERVWEYVNRFTSFTPYIHHVQTLHKGEVYPLPVNLGTINQFFHASFSPQEARNLITQQAGEYADITPKNLNDQGIKLIGRPLYEAFVKNYTAKQWQVDPELLPATIIRRLPVRYTYNSNYFNDPHQGLPASGYQSWFNNLVDNSKIDIRCQTDFFDNSQPFSRDNTRGKLPILYTGPVDKYFDYSLGALKWRTVDFTEHRYEDTNHLGCSVMNYADLDIPYTRSIEFKNFHPEWKEAYEQPTTIVWDESSRNADTQAGDEPYYPVKTPEDKDIFQKYKALEEQEPSVIFGGRLGDYAYFDMDQTINSALICWEKKMKPLLTQKSL